MFCVCFVDAGEGCNTRLMHLPKTITTMAGAVPAADLVMRDYNEKEEP